MGLEEDLNPAEDDDFEVDLAVVDDVSFALRFVAAGFEALESESIPVPTTLSLRD
mgnify:CR=1 FL=1